MAGVAVKVTAVPLHVGFVPDVIAMLTDGVTVAVVVKLIALLVAVVVVTQVKLVVITTVTEPPVVPGSVYVSLLVPTLAAPFFH